MCMGQHNRFPSKIMDEFFETIQAGSKSKATVKNYAGREKKFLKWLKIDSPACWNDGNIIIPDLNRISAAIMCKFLSVQSIEANTGKMRSFSTPEGHHSMFVSFFARHKVRLPETFEDEWIEFSKGYKNKVAENIAAGVTPTAGSDKLSFKDYRLLALYAVASDTFYAHGFLVLAWNLMTRSGDVCAKLK